MAKKYYGDKEKPKKEKLTLKDLGVDGWSVAKTVIGVTAGSCATVALHNYAKNAVPTDISMFEKVITAVGIYFVTGMVGNQVGEYVKGEVDSVKEAVDKANEAIRIAKEQKEAENGAGA